MYAAFHRGDAEGALAHFHPDVEYDATMRVDGGTGRGREALGATIGHWVGAFDDWREEIEEVREADGRVCVVLVQRGRSKGAGIELEARYGVVYETDGETITRMTLYPDAAEALKRVGSEG
jgi:ketosteroid isomerase-like protein